MPMTTGNYETLSAMITPALFMTANGSLIISTSNRMSRIVDRIRALNDLSDRICRGETDLDYAQERLAHVQDQLNLLIWRGDRIRYALTANERAVVDAYSVIGSPGSTLACPA